MDEPPKSKSFQLFLPEPLHHALKVKATQERTTITALILAAIEETYPGLGGHPTTTPPAPCRPIIDRSPSG